MRFAKKAYLGSGSRALWEIRKPSIGVDDGAQARRAQHASVVGLLPERERQLGIFIALTTVYHNIALFSQSHLGEVCHET